MFAKSDTRKLAVQATTFPAQSWALSWRPPPRLRRSQAAARCLHEQDMPRLSEWKEDPELDSHWYGLGQSLNIAISNISTVHMFVVSGAEDCRVRPILLRPWAFDIALL